MKKVIHHMISGAIFATILDDFCSIQGREEIINMIVHLVLFKWKEEASSESISAAVEALKRLKSKIPNIVDLSCGQNFTNRGQGFQHGLVVKFRDRRDLEEYLPHPAHQEVAKNLVKPILADIIALDYEVE